ncbi:unnamed protein product, partial [Symbiodinium sp. CCMP2456]
KRDLQKATARFLNTLFWRLPQDTIELTTKPRGQSSEEYWMLPRLLDALGHPDDEAVEDLLQVLSPLASSVQAVKKEDLEEEFAHLVFAPQNTLQRERETPAQRLLREAAGMISDGERVSVLVYLLRLLRPRFLRRALDWKASVRDFVLDLILNDRVLTELTTAMGIADEFWVVVVQVLESGGLPGQRWVAQTLRWLVRAAEQEAPQAEEGGEQVGDLRLVRSACSPKVLVPLAKYSALGQVGHAPLTGCTRQCFQHGEANACRARARGRWNRCLTRCCHCCVICPPRSRTRCSQTPCDGSWSCSDLDSAKLLRTKGQPDAADSVATFASRMILTYLSTGLVTELVKRFPLDTTLDKTLDDGTKIFHALPFEVLCESKKAMNTDILLTPTGPDEAMSVEPSAQCARLFPDVGLHLPSTRVSIEYHSDIERCGVSYCLVLAGGRIDWLTDWFSDKPNDRGDVVKVAFKPGFAKISQGRVFCGFDRATSKGDGKEEFVLKVLPVFVFRSIPRNSVNDLLVNGHFEAVIQACSWCYAVLAKELESNEDKTPLDGLNPERVPVFPFLRLALDIIHRLEAARPGDAELVLLEEQVRVAGETMLLLSRVPAFREAMLGGSDWEHVPVFLDIMKRRRREERVLAQLLGVTDDKMEVRNKKLAFRPEIAAAATGKASRMEIQTVEQVLEEVVPSPFTALSAGHVCKIRAANDFSEFYKCPAVLYHVAEMYALLLSEGWQPTFQETQCRPHEFMEALRLKRPPTSAIPGFKDVPMAPRVLRGLVVLAVAFGFLAGPSFVSGPRQPSIRVLRRAGDPAAEEVEERHLPLPEATHFVEEEAAGCIEEGCTVEDIVRIQHKLETDEGRLREAIEMLQVARDSFSVDSSPGIGLLRMSLSRIHSLNNKLQGLITSQGEQIAKEFGAYLAFGHGDTGGFLSLNRSPQVA